MCFIFGYLGVEREGLARTTITSIPNRKKRNLDQTQEEIEYNKSPSKKIIVIESILYIFNKSLA